MSETELAIKYLQPIADSATVGRYGDMLNIALAALREQAERGKGCEYCNSLICYKGFPYREDDQIVLFCKMCGKRLEEHHEDD